MNKIFLNVTIATILGMTLGGCDTESIIRDIAGDEDEEFSRATVYLRDSNGTGVADIAYSCSGGTSDNGDLSTAGNTPSTGDVAVAYWPGYDVSCTFTFDNVPKLYLFDDNGPINDVRMHCIPGASIENPSELGNAPSGTCNGYFVIN